tara:strand:- start:5162 stop:5611 length:450 start_codon:yes stop_codon:yes gene_type:complete
MENLINNLLIKKKKLDILQKNILRQSLEDYKKIHQINFINEILDEENTNDIINLIETTSEVINNNQSEINNENTNDIINLIETTVEVSNDKQKSEKELTNDHSDIDDVPSVYISDDDQLIIKAKTKRKKKRRKDKNKEEIYSQNESNNA